MKINNNEYVKLGEKDNIAYYLEIPKKHETDDLYEFDNLMLYYKDSKTHPTAYTTIKEHFLDEYNVSDFSDIANEFNTQDSQSILEIIQSLYVFQESAKTLKNGCTSIETRNEIVNLIKDEDLYNKILDTKIKPLICLLVNIIKKQENENDWSCLKDLIEDFKEKQESSKLVTKSNEIIKQLYDSNRGLFFVRKYEEEIDLSKEDSTDIEEILENNIKYNDYEEQEYNIQTYVTEVILKQLNNNKNYDITSDIYHLVDYTNFCDYTINKFIWYNNPTLIIQGEK